MTSSKISVPIYNSPYQPGVNPVSFFGGNGLLISPANLISHGLLGNTQSECHFPSDAGDYESVIPFNLRRKHRALHTDSRQPYDT